MRKTDSVIEIERLTKEYRVLRAVEDRFSGWIGRSLFGRNFAEETFLALNDVSLSIGTGEMVGIVGRNGSGKSTLLKILSRVTRPTSGSVRIRGKVSSLLEVGTGFHPDLSGRENIYLNGAILGMRRREVREKFDEIVDFAGISAFLDVPVKRYSSGMYVRLAFAIAAHLEPDILVVDEVLAVGDAEFQKRCMGKMQQVSREEGRTILFVSHQLAAITALCDRAILMDRGRLIEDGDPYEVVAHYLRKGSFSGRVADLSTHVNRTVGGGGILRELRLSEPASEVPYGRPLVFEVDYVTKGEIINPQFCFIVTDAEGRTAFSLISSFQPNSIPSRINGKGTIRCELAPLSLMPGPYALTVNLWQPGQKLDEIENAMALEVVWHDRAENQIPWSSRHGMIYQDAKWSTNE